MVLTRKNMLFCGNRQAAENTAVICSLLGSCKECGVNPREWLNDVISRLPYYLTPKSGKNLTELLPDRWVGCRQSHDTLPTVPGMSMDNPRTVRRQTVHAIWTFDGPISLTPRYIHNSSRGLSLAKNQMHKMYLLNRLQRIWIRFESLNSRIKRELWTSPKYRHQSWRTFQAGKCDLWRRKAKW